MGPIKNSVVGAFNYSKNYVVKEIDNASKSLRSNFFLLNKNFRELISSPIETEKTFLKVIKVALNVLLFAAFGFGAVTTLGAAALLTTAPLLATVYLIEGVFVMKIAVELISRIARSPADF